MTHWKPKPNDLLEEKAPWIKIQEWAKKRQEILAVVLVFILVLAVGVPYYLKSRSQAESDAVQKLSIAQYYLNAQVDPKNGPFKSEPEKFQAALQQFQQVTQQGAGTWAAKVATFYVGKCQLVMGQHSQAYVAFDEAAQRLKGTPLGEAAWVGKATSLLLQQKWTEAAGVMEQCLVQYPDGHLAPTIRLDLVDTYLKAGQKAKATQILQDIVKADDKSVYGKEAARMLKTL
jgi:tetratricopeptide (TPR) repeat protein